MLLSERKHCTHDIFRFLISFFNWNFNVKCNICLDFRKNKKRIYICALQHCIYLIIGYTNNIAVNLNFLFPFFTFISFIIFMTFFIVVFLWSFSSPFGEFYFFCTMSSGFINGYLVVERHL